MKRSLFFFAISLFVVIGKSQIADVLLPSEMDREISIHHKAFSLSYNTNYLQPSWVCYKVTKARVNTENHSKAKYRPDPLVTTRSASTKDYKDSGYLMAQFVNNLDVKQITDGEEECFYLSNISPMKLAYYNHVWLKAEQLIRLWTVDNDGLYVVCGPILADSPFPAIGENNISVPKRYYKAVYDPKNKKALGFIFKNGTSAPNLKAYIATIDAIEKETGIDLFPSLEDEIEVEVEGKIDLALWNFELEE